jgi:hypothetical protein
MKYVKEILRPVTILRPITTFRKYIDFFFLAEGHSSEFKPITIFRPL